VAALMAASDCENKACGNRRREASEEATRQPAMIVNHDAPVGHSGVIWNHSIS
jgi:hypothetical protein